MSRKIYCLLLAFVLVLSVSCVAASDANQTADTLTQADETDGIQKVTYENTISNESTSETNGEQYTMDLKNNIDDYGTLTANVTVNESVKGNITFSINDTEKEIYNQTVAIENGSASFSGYTINASGKYIVTATYAGDANLTSKTINKLLMITRNSPDLEIVSKIINDMGNIQVNITLNRNATGNITLAFNDTKKIIEIVNGTAILENYSLEKGNYTMQAYYDGDRDYFKAVKNDTLNVEKSITELRIDSLVSETGMMDIGAFVNENATGRKHHNHNNRCKRNNNPNHTTNRNQRNSHPRPNICRKQHIHHKRNIHRRRQLLQSNKHHQHQNNQKTNKPIHKHSKSR